MFFQTKIEISPKVRFSLYTEHHSLSSKITKHLDANEIYDDYVIVAGLGVTEHNTKLITRTFAKHNPQFFNFDNDIKGIQSGINYQYRSKLLPALNNAFAIPSAINLGLGTIFERDGIVTPESKLTEKELKAAKKNCNSYGRSNHPHATELAQRFQLLFDRKYLIPKFIIVMIILNNKPMRKHLRINNEYYFFLIFSLFLFFYYIRHG